METELPAGSREEKGVQQEMLDPFKYSSLETMIAFSISQCKDAEIRRKMANNVLIIGGLARTGKLVEELED